MIPEDDRELTAAFVELRREEEGRTPPFAEVVRRLRRPRRMTPTEAPHGGQV